MFNSCAVQSAPKLNNFSMFDLHAKKALKFWVNTYEANLDRREKTKINYNMITMFLHVSRIMRFLQNIN